MCFYGYFCATMTELISCIRDLQNLKRLLPSPLQKKCQPFSTQGYAFPLSADFHIEIQVTIFLTSRMLITASPLFKPRLLLKAQFPFFPLFQILTITSSLYGSRSAKHSLLLYRLTLQRCCPDVYKRWLMTLIHLTQAGKEEREEAKKRTVVRPGRHQV